MANEPVLTGITALVVATIVLLVAFGIHITGDQKTAIVGFIAALYAVGLLVRANVVPLIRARR